MSKEGTSLTARFETKLPQNQKDYFRQAAELAGFSTLSQFVIQACIEKSDQIHEKHKAILVTERDRKVFFEALMNPSEPTQYMRHAAKRYKKAVARK